MKVSIIGGGGLVGSCAAYALQCGGVVREIALLDLNAELAAGHALDLMHGSASVADQTIVSGGYEQVTDSDLICITAGLRRKPEESRLDLINRNVDLFLSILADIQRAGCKGSALILVVSNPVDVLTYLAATRLDLPVGQVIQIHSLFSEVLHEGQTYLAVVRKTMRKLADTQIVVGDMVRFRPTDQLDEIGRPEAVIEQALERKTVLTRATSFKGHESHPIVANADQLLIVASIRNPVPKWGLIDRMLIAAEAGG